jgi:starvation-inducible DNA-binding protein
MKPTEKNHTHKKLGFSYLETAEIVIKMNQLLSNYQIHFHRLQNFTWNVRGRAFFELHDKFGEMYHRTFDNINKIAERIRVFNQLPVSQMREALEISELKDSPAKLTGEEMVKQLTNDFEILLSFLVEATDVAAANGDVGTTEMLNGFIQDLEKDHWMLNAWLSSFKPEPFPGQN